MPRGPNIIILGSGSQYRKIPDFVMSHGEDRTSRGHKTRDAGLVTIVLNNPNKSLPIDTGRGVNPVIGAVEAIQLIAGVQDANLVLKVAPQFRRYLDGDTFHGSYGERIGKQALHVITKIKADTGTRQAIISLWDAQKDNIPGKHDYPCTLNFGFTIAYNELQMNVVMRSSDAWLGIPYDLFQFSQLQVTMARCLGMKLGSLTLTTMSLHMYEHDFETYRNTEWHIPMPGNFHPVGIGNNGTDFLTVMQRAESIIRDDIDFTLTKSEKWYYDKLHPTSNVG